MSPRLPYRLLSLLVAVTLAFLAGGAWAADAQTGAQGTLVVKALKDAGRQSDPRVEVYPQGSEQLAATTALESPLALAPGTYRLVFEVLGGKVTRDNVLVKAGRTSTVILGNLAALRVNVLDKAGKDLGVGVEVYDGVAGQKLGSFLSGETILAMPGIVDVKVDIPPQPQWIRKVQLQTGGIAHFDFTERSFGELRVRPLLEGRDVSDSTQVTVYEAGTRKEVARSEPRREHRFTLDPGAYDIFVVNPTGRGKPFMMDRAEIKKDQRVERDVSLDQESTPASTTESL